MLAIVKKVKSYKKKEFSIYSATGHVVDIDGKYKEYLEEKEQIGEICLDEFHGTVLFAGKLLVNGYESRMEFELVKPEKWNGRIGKMRTGRCFGKDGRTNYILIEKLHEQSSFWIFKSGYTYYEMQDEINGKKYTIKDICFAADMHYYYIYNEAEELVSAIHKPYKNPGEDEYRVYAKNNDLTEMMFFLISYIDFFYYPYDGESPFDRKEFYDVHMDSAAYNISCDELLQLYDEDFTRKVILNA